MVALIVGLSRSRPCGIVGWPVIVPFPDHTNLHV